MIEFPVTVNLAFHGILPRKAQHGISSTNYHLNLNQLFTAGFLRMGKFRIWYSGNRIYKFDNWQKASADNYEIANEPTYIIDLQHKIYSICIRMPDTPGIYSERYSFNLFRYNKEDYFYIINSLKVLPKELTPEMTATLELAQS